MLYEVITDRVDLDLTGGLGGARELSSREALLARLDARGLVADDAVSYNFV